MKVQYITNEQGQPIGVLLDLEDYRQLLASASSDPELLTDLNHLELAALAGSKLVPETQETLDRLLDKQRNSSLTQEEEDQLDELLAQVDQLTILKARAQYTLTKQ